MVSSKSPFSVDELKRYSRQLFLPEIGYPGQLALKNASALIVGLGGLGSPCSLYLNASGMGKLILVDGDQVEISNLPRQVIHTTCHINQAKTDSASRLLSQLNPHTEIELISNYLTEEIAKKILPKVDIVIDCSDNFATRYMVNSLCITYQKPLISASVIAFSGQLCCFDFRQSPSPCYACLFPQEPETPNTENCSEVGVLSTAAGILGVMQAAEAMKMLMGLCTLTNSLLLFDTLTLKQRIIRIQADKHCHCNI